MDGAQTIQPSAALVDGVQTITLPTARPSAWTRCHTRHISAAPIRRRGASSTNPALHARLYGWQRRQIQNMLFPHLLGALFGENSGLRGHKRWCGFRKQEDARFCKQEVVGSNPSSSTKK